MSCSNLLLVSVTYGLYLKYAYFCEMQSNIRSTRQHWSHCRRSTFNDNGIYQVDWCEDCTTQGIPNQMSSSHKGRMGNSTYSKRFCWQMMIDVVLFVYWTLKKKLRYRVISHQITCPNINENVFVKVYRRFTKAAVCGWSGNLYNFWLTFALNILFWLQSS